MDSCGHFTEDGRWIDENQEYFKRWLSNHHSKRAVLKLKKWRKPRSKDPGSGHNQNGYYFGVVIPIVIENHGFLTADEAHDWCKTTFNKKVREKFSVRTQKLIVTEFGGSTADLDTLEFELYLERIRMFEAMEFGSVIPLPNEIIYEENN
jgi:hypothetical protein